MTAQEAENLLKRNKKEFRNLWCAAWDGYENRHELKAFVQRLDSTLTDAAFDRGWQYCLIFHEQFKAAQIELVQLLIRNFPPLARGRS